jgi:hypothetical protein
MMKLEEGTDFGKLPGECGHVPISSNASPGLFLVLHSADAHGLARGGPERHTDGPSGQDTSGGGSDRLHGAVWLREFE